MTTPTRPKGRWQTGFTLIEMLIALTLFGSIMGLAFPAGDRLYRKAVFIWGRDQVLHDLSGLGSRARREGRTIILTGTLSGEAAPVPLPANWKISVSTPVVYRDTGYCLGGRLRLETPSDGADYVLSPPFCQPRAP